MAQAVASLVQQGRMTAERLTERLGEHAVGLERVLADAAEAAHDRGAARRIEQALAGPLRQLAVTALAGRPDIIAQMAEEFIDELRGHVYNAFAVPWVRVSDLFEFGNPVAPHLLEIAGELTRSLQDPCKGLGAVAKERLIDAEIAKNLAAYRDWFGREGIKLYIEQMAKDKVWAGAPELQALAAHLGVTLAIFRDVGAGIRRDEGIADAGSASSGAPLTPIDVETLRKLEVIEGRVVGEARQIYFKRLSRADVENRLEGHRDLAEKFLKLYDANFRFRQGLPPEIGMFRHRHAHWSAVSTGLGAFDLTDPENRQTAPPVTSNAMQVDDEAVQSGTGSQAAFARRPLAVTGVETHYADHRFGSSRHAFSLAALDGRLSGREAIGIVNAANEKLLGGGGIDAAILSEEGLGQRAVSVGKALKRLGKSAIASGEAIAADSSGNLLAQNVSAIIHAVGPRKGDKGFDDVLRATVRSVLDQASERKLEVIIMANISSAIFGGNPVDTANVIQAEVERLLAAPPLEWASWLPNKIIFNNFPKEGKRAPTTEGDRNVKIVPKRKAEDLLANAAKYPKSTHETSSIQDDDQDDAIVVGAEDDTAMGANEEIEFEYNMQ